MPGGINPLASLQGKVDSNGALVVAVEGPLNIGSSNITTTGTVSAGAVTATGAVTAASVTATGTVTGGTVNAQTNLQANGVNGVTQNVIVEGGTITLHFTKGLLTSVT